jgi:hypothetical protein
MWEFRSLLCRVNEHDTAINSLINKTYPELARHQADINELFSNILELGEKTGITFKWAGASGADGWNRYPETKPENNHWYMVYSDRFSDGCKFTFQFYRSNEGFLFQDDRITHWRPLPPAPKE